MSCLEHIANFLGQELCFHLPYVPVFMIMLKQKNCAEGGLFTSAGSGEGAKCQHILPVACTA